MKGRDIFLGLHGIVLKNGKASKILYKIKYKWIQTKSSETDIGKHYVWAMKNVGNIMSC